MALHIVADALVDFLADQRVVEQGGADADGAGSGDQEFQGIFGGHDAALADDRDIVFFGDLVDLMGLQHGDGFDGRAGQAAGVVADDRLTGFDVDGHAHQGVDDGEGVGTGLDAQAGVAGDVGLVGRQLGDQRFFGYRAAGLDDAGGHFRVVAEHHAAFFHVRAGDVDFDGVDRGVVEAAGDFDVFLDGGAGDVGDEAGFFKIQRRQNVLDDVIGARVLQADGVEHAFRGFVDTVRLVAQARL